MGWQIPQGPAKPRRAPWATGSLPRDDSIRTCAARRAEIPQGTRRKRGVPWATSSDPTLKNEGWGTRKTIAVTHGQMLNHGVTQMYLTRKIRRSRIFTGRASINTRSRSVVTICSRVMRRKIRCEKLVEFITR
jgi:hypothetical protein